MKDLEEVNCEVRRVINLQISVSDRLNNFEENDAGISPSFQVCNRLNNHQGGFLNDAAYAWLSYGPHLVVFHVKTGESHSSWIFRGNVTSVSQFPSQPGELPLLLVGLDNGSTKLKDSMGLLCIFDCARSQILRAIRMPAGVEQACIVSGGAEWEDFSDKRPDNFFTETGGIACVVLRNLHHIMINLQRSLWDGFNSCILMDELSPAELDFSIAQHSVSKNQFHKGKHPAYKLSNVRIERHVGFDREKFELAGLCVHKFTHTLISSTRIGCLISGCLGRLIIWQNDGSVGWISAPVDDNLVVSHLALLEPADDPRPFYYLWVAYQDDSLRAAPILRMYALLFERKYSDKGTNLYFNLEAEPTLKFELELDEGDNIISLSTIERENTSDQTTDSVSKRGEDSLLLISTSDRTFLFDLNQWYKEQMPQTICECQNPNSILASYHMEPDMQSMANSEIINTSYVPSTLCEYPSYSASSPEELFYPNALSLEWIQLTPTKLTVWRSRGIQADLLRDIAIAGPIVLMQPSEIFHKCLSIGLVPFNTELSFVSDQNIQREMLLSLCLEQRWSTFLTKCAQEWSDGSASYLYPTFLKWGIQRASAIKIVADRLCVPLFDQSGNTIGETEVRTLRFCSQQLECLSNVVAKLSVETEELIKQQRMLKHVSMYFQVLLWFYDVGLLPETQDMEEGTLPISLTLKVPYPLEKLILLYEEKRKLITEKACDQDEHKKGLFIDELIMRECPLLQMQWSREGADINANGDYPPPSLQSLLRSYLTDCHQTECNEIAYKHQITIYLLMDLAMLLQGSYPAVDQLIKYPSAFKMSPSLIKLTQAFWLLDHEDYQGFLDMMTGQLVSDADAKDWHHTLVLQTLVRNNQHKLALTYLRVRKPPLSSIEDQGMLISLSVEHGLVQTAFHRRPASHYAQLLTCFFQACKTYGKLDDILHLALDSEEEEIFIKYLEDEHYDDIRLLYYLQRCRYTEASCNSSVNNYAHTALKNVQPASFIMLDAYNMTLPAVTKRFTINMARTNMDIGLESRYPRPMSHYKSNNKSLNIHEIVIRKARETYLKTEKGRVPFISAPSVPLRQADSNAHTNCVLFPTLTYKNEKKRTLQQIYDSDDDHKHNTLEESKRRKLCNESNVINNLSTQDTGICSAFSTPLIKRKANTSNSKDALLEIPHSILKIRQLIRDSTSPTILINHASESNETPGVDKDKRVSRQIRFNISQSGKSTIYENIKEPEDQNEEENDNKINTTRESDACYSSDVGSKSYNESNLLFDSIGSGKSILYPRPRRSLRQSAQHSRDFACKTPGNLTQVQSVVNPPSSSVNILQRHSTFITSTEGNGGISTMSPSIPQACSSLLDTSIYGTRIFSDDSSFEIGTLSFTNKPLTGLGKRYRSSENKRMDTEVSRVAFENTCINNENLVHLVDDFETGTEDNLSSTNVQHTISYQHVPANSKSDMYLNTDEYNEGSTESFKNLNQCTSEVTINNNSCPESKEVQSTTYYSKDADNIVKPNQSDNELDCVEDKDADNDDVFESFSDSVEKNGSHLSPSVLNKEFANSHTTYRKDTSGYEKQVNIDVDITDDESSSFQGADIVYEQTNTENKIKFSAETSIYTGNIHDDPNITDDESNSAIDEIHSKLAVPKNSEHQNLGTCLIKHSTTTIYEECNSSLQREEESSNHFLKNMSTSDSGRSDSLKVYKEATMKTAGSSCEDIKAKKMPVKKTKSNRSSVVKDVDKDPVESQLQHLDNEKSRRTRRAASLVADVFMSSRRSEDDMFDTNTRDMKRTLPPTKMVRRRSMSVTKDLQDVIDPNNESKAKIQLRRSARRAASVQKEVSDTVKSSAHLIGQVSSDLNMIKMGDDDKIVKKRSGRPRKVIKSFDDSALHQRTESAVIKELTQEHVETMNIKHTRKRGKSEPKELTPITTSRNRRCRSVSIDVIPEKISDHSQELKKKRNSLPRIIENQISSPAANTRSRRSSIQSVPEESGEAAILLPGKKSDRATDKQINVRSSGRERRASSVELTQSELKRKSRNLRTRNIAEEAIDEEPLEPQESLDINTSTIAKQVSTRRKRTTSDSSLGCLGNVEYKEVNTDKSRKRQVSNRNIDDSNQFLFSHPVKTSEAPLDRKIIGQVPNYIFSPPQTRSKLASSQQRSNINTHIRAEATEQGDKVLETTSQGNIIDNCVGKITMIMYDSQFHKKFVIPKRSRHTTD